MATIILASTTITLAINLSEAKESLAAEKKIILQTSELPQKTAKVSTLAANVSQTKGILIQNGGVTINGKYFTREQLTQLIDSSATKINVCYNSESQNQSTSNTTTNSTIMATDYQVKPMNAALALGPLLAFEGSTLWIPGVGEVELTADGIILVGVGAIAVGSWLGQIIVKAFFQKSQTSHGPVKKENRKKQGREVNEGKKSKTGWKSNSNKNSDRPMKKHTPSPKHKVGK